MEIIKMESSIKNYIYRLLEHYVENLPYTNLPPSRIKHEYQQASIAMKRLMGEEPKVSLNKDIDLLNLGEEK